MNAIVEFEDDHRPNSSPARTRDADCVVLLRSDGTYKIWKDPGGGWRPHVVLVDTTRVPASA